MQHLPSQPSINRGTLTLLDPNTNDTAVSPKNLFFVFQYNPEKLLHTFNQAMFSENSAETEMQATQPAEFFNLTFELDCVDIDSSTQNQSIGDFGLHPSLAMLELMMQPQLVNNQMVIPIVIFKWGAKRTVAVNLVSMSVEEKSFDITLNPTRATVSLVLRVLNVSEVGSNVGARSVCLNHQNARASLIDAYKLLTGQPNPMGGANSSGWGSVAGAAGVQSAKKSA